MLNCTAATDPKVLALRGDPLDTLAMPGNCSALRIAGLVSRNRYINPLAKQRIFNKDDLAIVTGKALSVEVDRLNRQVRENLGNLRRATFHLKTGQGRRCREITLPMFSGKWA